MNIVVLTGAGMSAESGIKTFRGAGGLWEGYPVMDVASPAGWEKDKELVLRFYNERRAQLKEVQPNAGHLALADLEKKYSVQIITQNVDDLHERAGSTNVLHLHGELRKARSTVDPNLIYDWDGDITFEDYCEKGYQLRPHIVWFGESVPMIPVAEHITAQADVLVIIGTSMQVYPAAGLVYLAPTNTPIYYIDPYPAEVMGMPKLTTIKKTATAGIPELLRILESKTS